MARGSKNPSVSVPEGLPKGYKPMTSGVQRLEIPELSGWHRHWFRGTAERLARAQQAGYRFVDKEDLGDAVNNFDIAGDSDAAGSTDMGTRVSVISGDTIGESGQAGRMYLMECPDEIFEYAQSILADRNGQIAETLLGGAGKGESGETADDVRKTYNRAKPSNLFTPKTRRR